MRKMRPSNHAAYLFTAIVTSAITTFLMNVSMDLMVKNAPCHKCSIGDYEDLPKQEELKPLSIPTSKNKAQVLPYKELNMTKVNSLTPKELLIKQLRTDLEKKS